jgi:1,4-dihydroxy-2-naphthoyl-CoA hydrolase
MQFTSAHVERANAMQTGTLVEHLGIRFDVDEKGRFTASMPVDQRTLQPMGLLHGGATAALAESLGSMGSAMLVDLSRYAVVGTEVSANHLRGVRSGHVIATGELVHQGRTMHVWDIRVLNEAGELCAVCRLSNLIIEQRK